MAEELDFSAFDGATRFDQLAEATARGAVIKCGWIPPDARTPQQAGIDAAIRAALPRFTIRGRFTAKERRYPLWQAAVTLFGRHLKYNWQQTGSCVGAGGGNMAKTAQCVEIVLKREPKEYRELWWPYTYGRSRFLAGIGGRGEGSIGSAWAKAATTAAGGFFEIDPTGFPDLPDYKEQDGWLVQPAKVELEWSDGGAISDQWVRLGSTRLFHTAAQMRSAEDCAEALMNGYPITQASMFGFSNPRVKGSQFPIRVAEWNGQWSHQTYIDEVWDHPELNGLYFRWGNNWGPTAHGKPTGDEPPGGVYISARTLDQICRTGEVYAFSAFDGFPARDLDFSAF